MGEEYRIAPPGFTFDEWRIFEEEGFLVLENVLTEAEIEQYLEVMDRVVAVQKSHQPGDFLELERFIECDPVFANLIDHSRHVGFVYDLYGEQLKLHQSQLFLRPRGQGRSSIWHADGPRALPYQVFSPRLPLQVKMGYWLTDLPRAGMGNLVVLPGSQNLDCLDAYETRASVPGERIVCLPKGSLTIMDGRIWHRVEANETDHVRKNLYLSYCPSWIMAADRMPSDPAWLQTLGREQRIIMRSYANPYDYAKPPAEDFPLFLDRTTGLDRDQGAYPDHIRLHRRKRKTTLEQWSDIGMPAQAG